MQIEDCYFLGKITRKHGIKGQLVLKLDTDQPENYKDLDSVLLDYNGSLVPFFINSRMWNSKGNLIINFEDVNFDTATELINLNAYLPLSSLPKLEGNKFYYHEVINFSVINDEGKNIGQIVSFNDETAQNLFIIKNNENKEVIIPIVDSWILEVNREEKYIKMDLPIGIDEL